MSNNHSGRIALAAANIARGVASGGIHGAAAGAIRSFLPEIIKTAVILAAAALFLPLLIFTAIPNIIFGYDSSVHEEIIEFTNKARAVDAAYRQIDAYNQEGLESIVAACRAAYTGGDGEGFDDIELSSVVDNTDLYWLIAITSVAYRQDLNVMDAGTIKNAVISKLTYSAQIIPYIIGEGDEAAESRVLQISISDLDPAKLMEKHNFTEEERNWARLLYNTLYRTSPQHEYDGYRVPGEALSDERFAAMLAEAEKYLGYPYVWGGSTPATSFDCSGYVCWIINRSGAGSVGRTTAQGLYNLCTPVSRAEAKPGDLVFFEKTYQTPDTVTHVGLYVGEGMMINAGNPIKYESIDSPYRAGHFYAFGRLPPYG
jgi:hypothetical protein